MHEIYKLHCIGEILMYMSDLSANSSPMENNVQNANVSNELIDQEGEFK